MLHFGDLAYAESTGTDWEHWSRQNEALASRVPYMVSIGNHEYDYLSDDHHNDPSVTDGNYSVGTYVLRKIHQFTTVCLGLFCDVSIGRSRHSGVPFIRATTAAGSAPCLLRAMYTSSSPSNHCCFGASL